MGIILSKSDILCHADYQYKYGIQSIDKQNITVVKTFNDT